MLLSTFRPRSEDTKKYYFTLIDFRGATSHLADPDFDCEPVQIYEPGVGDPVAPPEDVPPAGEDGEAMANKPGGGNRYKWPARPHAACHRRQDEEGLCRWRRGDHNRRA